MSQSHLVILGVAGHNTVEARSGVITPL